MCDIDPKFERIRDFLSQIPSEFFVAYRKPSVWSPKMRWVKAAHQQPMEHRDYSELASRYEKLALYCYRSRRNIVALNAEAGPNSKVRRWFGMNVIAPGTGVPLPRESDGSRWWHFLVIGRGPIRAAGYVIVTKVAAKDRAEGADKIARLQEIWTSP